MSELFSPRIPCLTPAQAGSFLLQGHTCVADCRGRLADRAWGREAYAAGHLPGADFWEGEEELSAPPKPLEGRHPLPALNGFLERLRERGYHAGRPVLAYGFYGFRFLWLLDLLGFSRLAFLAGPWEEVALPPQSVRRSGSGGAGCADAWNGARMARETELLTLKGPLVDCRAAERFRGEREPLDPVAGHIPGAVNLPWMELFTEEGAFLMPRPEGAIPRLLLEHPTDPVLYCGSGITACVVWLALLQWGRESRLYAGGWSAWLSDPGRPVARGCGT